MGALNEDGYGRLFYGGRSLQAHKVVLEMVIGRPLAADEVSRHRCVGSRACCNPRHLLPGTIADNNRDTAEHGRVAHGERQPGHVLTESDVEEILRLAPTMGYGRYERLGRLFGVTGKTIANVVSGKKWRHVARRAAARVAAARMVSP